jgi:endonuclease YncB( thermonuclease family)
MRLLGLSAALLLAISALAGAGAPRSFEARVVGIADGDTITVLNSDSVPQKIRLAGIDSPEKGQAFGDRSRQNLSRLVHDQTVRIEWTKIDKYGRLVGKVLVGKQDVNLAQVSDGLAWHYKYYEDEQSKQDRAAYASAELRAREQKLGLWRDANPVPPWEWRHGPAEPSTVASGEGPVRKSRNNICHDPSMPNYLSVKEFTSYRTLEECVASGARLPR